ncbi:hypothetical protein tinsulaeT_10890 [Thalassotalea insulae]|uniref:HTH cro/C1-type domain-containing protein n=1 Tax=Thalassotalea insulae TaxID=2056778 RepID=A0ABQ6GQX8_9GAMM|nr:helix-turn-helix transcriptional regulator [Thalassotalea insulae]GLX77749.1 hypothetical protein tinsulaeT_10890 [Thalassotalea insulae]
MSQVQVNIALIKKLRRTLGLSQSDMAAASQKKRLNVALSTIKRIESGKSVSLRTIRNIALFHQCPIENLMLNDKYDEGNSIDGLFTDGKTFGEKESVLCSSGYDFELEQFEMSLMRALKLSSPHLICLKSDEPNAIDSLVADLSKLVARKDICSYEVSIEKAHHLWFTPLQHLANLFIESDDSRGGSIPHHFYQEKKGQFWLQDIITIANKDKLPRVIFIKQIDNAQKLLINSLVKIIHAARQCPLVFVLTTKGVCENLSLLQQSLNVNVPKLTIELAVGAANPASVALM